MGFPYFSFWSLQVRHEKKRLHVVVSQAVFVRLYSLLTFTPQLLYRRTSFSSLERADNGCSTSKPFAEREKSLCSFNSKGLSASSPISRGQRGRSDEICPILFGIGQISPALSIVGQAPTSGENSNTIKKSDHVTSTIRGVPHLQGWRPPEAKKEDS